MYPQRLKVLEICKKLKKIFRNTTDKSAIEVINQVNPII
jgi:hypothetical protein